MRITTWIVALAALVLTRTSAAQPTASLSGPQVQIPAASKRQVKTVLLARMAADGWTVKDTSESVVTLDHPANPARQHSGDSTWVISAVYRFTYTLVDADGGVRVFGHGVVLVRSHSGEDALIELTSTHVQPMLDSLRAAFRRGLLPSKPRARDGGASSTSGHGARLGAGLAGREIAGEDLAGDAAAYAARVLADWMKAD